MRWYAKVAWVVYVVVAVLVSVAVVVPNVRLYTSEQSTGALVAQQRFLGERLRSGSGEQMQTYFPEGYFFSHALYGLTWLDLARRDPGRKAEALREARWALRALESTAGRAPFDPDLRPAYGVFYVGWSNRLRGGIVQLAGRNAPEAARFRADCAALASSLAADGPFLQAYPGQAWPVDTVVAVSGLRLHDRVFGSKTYGSVVDDWVAEARQRADPTTRMLPHQVEPQLTGARATSQSIIQRFLPEIDAGWAGEDYAQYRQWFADTRFGLPVVLEYPRGESGSGDVDSGPLILGVSASATVVTIGAARVHGDQKLAGPLTGFGEALGAPIRLGGQKRYAFGVLPIGDAFLAWSAAAPQGEAGSEPGEYTEYGNVVGWWWRLPWHAFGLLVIGLLWLPIISRWRRAWLLMAQ
ncbi:hypothetical protein [Flindersiella endophytica]